VVLRTTASTDLSSERRGCFKLGGLVVSVVFRDFSACLIFRGFSRSVCSFGSGGGFDTMEVVMVLLWWSQWVAVLWVLVSCWGGGGWR
jgi:hypothetical protein